MKRGYFGIGIYYGKNSVNVGVLWRTAANLGADFIFTVGRRYQKQQRSDITKAWRHIPLYSYENGDGFIKHIPCDCKLVAIEIDDKAKDLKAYNHPERCIYLLGAEDRGIPPNILQLCHDVVMVNSVRSMNVAVTGGIVMYDRLCKRG
jgi:tRNA G18 (ribose-2'-O)-methylase SpoU